MSHCDCQQITTKTKRSTLKIALILNASMFVIGLIAGIIAQSTGLIADSLDMLADALAYTIGLIALERTARFKALAATFSGGLLLILGMALLIEVIWHIWVESFPESTLMIIIASLSLIVNSFMLRLLNPFRQGEVHLRATWIFTRVDIIANVGVIGSGIAVALTHVRFPDLIVGFVIALYVIKEAIEILKAANKEKNLRSKSVLT